ncbi:MAG: SpoIID/LytB domain-containing protein [Actinobacteria bacterium]|nr:MAG: SpoIID/LytB domain-containing protein [Actinomycetota bacterium]
MPGRARQSATLDAFRGPRGMSIRPFAIVVVSALGLAGGAASSGTKTVPPTIRTQPTFFISGHGWGHGLGMSQYGAYGYAQHGWTYDRIVKHYYTGTTIGQAPVSRVRVLLADKAKRVTIASKLPFQVVDGAGSKHALAAGSYTVGAAFKYADPADPQAKPAPLAFPLEFRPGATAVALNGRGYRGSFRVLKLAGGKIRVVNVVGLDLYLRGVVPSEMPKTWAAEALKAQAVAARSYALSHLHAGGGFDLYPDTRDQVYLGIPHEAPSTNAAVGATAGQVVFYKGKVASTYFFSTSGGRTASVQDVYPNSPPIPYLASVPDPYDSISPYHDWGPFRFTARKLGRGLKSPGKLLDVETIAAPSGRVQSVVATGSKGEASATGSEVRAAFGLRSTWFQVGVLALGAPTAPLTYGTTAALSGIARGVSSVELQELVAGGWKPVSKLTPHGGAVAPRVKPDQSSRFRLVAGTIASDAVAVAVAPSIRLHVPAELTGFWGAVRPGTAGATVTVQRQAGSAWRPVARVKTTVQGRFTIPRSVVPGTYRARVSAKGFAPGLSKPVTV